MRTRTLVTAMLAFVVTGGALAVHVAASTPANADVAAGFSYSQGSVVAAHLELPWGLAFLPDQSALVSERGTARLLRVQPGQPPEVLGTVPNVAPNAGEGGLLGLTLSPDYVRDGWVYAYLTTATDNRVVRFHLDDLQHQELVVGSIDKSVSHNGGRIAFGPDGMLYVSTGDGGGLPERAQDLQSRNGKILRVTPTGGIPADNPFGNLVYSYGHRNVQGLAWDSEGRLFASELGLHAHDELNYIVAGGNYGWPAVEGVGHKPQFRDPIVQWTPSDASPSGIAFDRGHLYVAALAGQRLWNVPIEGAAAGFPAPELQGTLGRLRTVAVAPDGWLWVMTSNNPFGDAQNPTDDRILRYPPVGSGATVFRDDFESNESWVVNPAGTDTATSGQWERGNPEPTFRNTTPLQLDTTASGSTALVTGPLAGATFDEFDVDGGLTTIRSRTFDLPATGTLTFTVSWYLAHTSNATTADRLLIQVWAEPGPAVTAVSVVGGKLTRAGEWTTTTVSLNPLSGKPAHIEIRAVDADGDSLVEAAVDDVLITWDP